MSLKDADVVLVRFRPWFYAAAVYNFVWGTSVILFPDWPFHLIRLPPPESPLFWQLVGMFVLVYAPAYAWAGRRPSAHAQIVMVGMLGKLPGPVGFLWALSVGLPGHTGSRRDALRRDAHDAPLGVQVADRLQHRPPLRCDLSGPRLDGQLETYPA